MRSGFFEALGFEVVTADVARCGLLWRDVALPIRIAPQDTNKKNRSIGATNEQSLAL